LRSGVPVWDGVWGGAGAAAAALPAETTEPDCTEYDPDAAVRPLLTELFPGDGGGIGVPASPDIYGIGPTEFASTHPTTERICIYTRICSAGLVFEPHGSENRIKSRRVFPNKNRSFVRAW